MRVIFAGTPAFAAQALEAILAAGHEVVLVLTQPDRPSGRGMKLQPSAVKSVALAHGIAVYQPERLKDPATHAPLSQAAANVMVVAAYGLILPQAVLDLPRYGCLNIHASLLPRWRGAAPIHRAIEAGDTQTGITVMQMDAGLDTGPMLAKESLTIHPHETTGELHDRLATMGATMIVAALKQLATGGKLEAQPQPSEGVTYANKIDKQEAQLDWALPAIQLDRKIRAFNPFPGASAQLSGQPVKIWHACIADAVEGSTSVMPGQVVKANERGIDVACGVSVLRLTELQRPGGRRLNCSDFLNSLSAADLIRT